MEKIKRKFIRVPHLSLKEAIREGGRNPFVDWIMIIIVSGFIGIVLVVIGISLYSRVTSGSIVSTDIITETKANSFDKKDLTSVIERFELKNNVQNQIKKGNNGFVAPTL